MKGGGGRRDNGECNDVGRDGRPIQGIRRDARASLLPGDIPLLVRSAAAAFLQIDIAEDQGERDCTQYDQHQNMKYVDIGQKAGLRLHLLTDPLGRLRLCVRTGRTALGKVTGHRLKRLMIGR